MKHVMMAVSLISILLIGSGCMQEKVKMPVSGEKAETIKTTISNAEGENVGEVNMLETEDGVLLSVDAKGLPAGVKGIHLHDTGVCTAPDFKSAGSHFNPQGKEHGFENPKGFHLGDLPNIEVDAQGNASYKMMMKGITLIPGTPQSILDEDGSAIVIHADPDDYKTDPAGNSGERIACGVLKR